jgi:hypothetical protein
MTYTHDQPRPDSGHKPGTDPYCVTCNRIIKAREKVNVTRSFLDDVRTLVTKHAPACNWGNCSRVAFYRTTTPTVITGRPQGYIVCEEHLNQVGKTERLPTADALTRVIAFLSGVP